MYENLTSLAITLQSGKGSIALILGSGISRSAGIPTGWEILINLIERLAALDGTPAPTNAEEWYRKKYKEKADYSRLLTQLVPTSAARQQLLRTFFEPNEEEREQGLDLTDILYQRDRETIAFVRPDLAVSGTGSWHVVQVAGIRAPSAV
jgi:hypothetical protein